MSEKLCLLWNDFKDNLIYSVGALKNDNNFTDVTLACEDGTQVEAHKVILASSSPFFQNLLSRKKHTHPLIYMRGVKSEDLLAIIDFLYCGEANVYQENLDSFLSLAKEFQLKGLLGKSANEKDAVPSIHPPVQTNMKTTEQNSFVPPQSMYEDQIVSSYGRTERTESLLSHNAEILQKLNEMSQSMMEKTIKTGNDGRTFYKCKVCGKEASQTQNLKNHIVRSHLDGVSIPCNICNKSFKAESTLAVHNSRHHRREENTVENFDIQ